MKSFWQEYPAGEFVPLAGSHRAEVAIIGAGYTGSWLAYWLRKSGLNTVVLDSHEPGHGASGRNGGLLLQGSALLLGESARRLGRQTAVELWQRTRESFTWVNALDRQYDVDLTITGSLYVGGDPSERAVIEETASLYTEAGMRARLVPREQQPPSLQALGYDLGLWVPDDASVHPLKVIAALLTEASRHGVAIYSDSPVTGYEHNTLFGDRFTLQADRVLVCTNAFVPDWLPLIARHIVPVRGQVLATEPLAPLDHQYPVYADHGFNYWHQRGDGRLIAGGFRHLDLAGEHGTELVLHPAIQDRLTRLALDLAGPSVAIEQRWAGPMAMTFDHLPLVGMLNDRLGVALGYSGHGSTVAPLAAKMLRDALVDDTQIFPPLDVSRIDTLREVNP